MSSLPFLVEAADQVREYDLVPADPVDDSAVLLLLTLEVLVLALDMVRGSR